MSLEDDIATSLPRPPLPAPARREAAIEEALRRFDGGGALPPAPAPARPALSWPRLGRPQAGILVGAALVALIGLPFAWVSVDRPAGIEGGDGAPRSIERAARPDPAAIPDQATRADPQRPPETTAAAADTAPPSETRIAANVAPAPAPPPPPVAMAAEQAERAAAPPAAAAMGRLARAAPAPAPPPAPAADEVIVTGSRVERLQSTGRGDWNACTIDDPASSLDGCRVDPGVADGLASAWRGDLDGAISAFDRAIAVAPRAAFAYLNRGMAHRRSGDLKRALADLDRAVRYAPRDARGYYQRSLVLRARGNGRRAEADENRAIDLDPRFAAVIG